MQRICLFVVVALAFCSVCMGQQAQDKSAKEAEAALFCEAAENIEMHRKGDAAVIFKSKLPEAVKFADVQITQTAHDFLFGALIFELVRPDVYKEELFKEQFGKLFNFAVLPFYWESYEPVQGQVQWQYELPVIKWCQDNGIKTKGHPLAWTHPGSNPEWLKRYPPEASEALLKARIMNIVGGFKGQIDVWDVVNEPVNTKVWLNPTDGAYMREPIEKVADYCEKALRWAHEANPDAHLMLNEFHLIHQGEFNNDPNKTVRQGFIELVTELKRRGAPLSGLGIQAHEPKECWFSPAETVQAFDELGRLGLPLHITEFIPQSGGKEITGDYRKGKWDEQAQAEFAEQMYRLAFGHPAVVSITWWAVHDKIVWLKGGGFLDAELNPKPAYLMLDKLINQEWKTNFAARTDPDGKVSFRGFFGLYNVELKTAGGKVHNFTMHLTRDGEKEFVFEVD